MAEKREPDEHDLADKDPIDVVRRMLAISPDDAAEVREAAAKAAERGGDS